MTPQSLLAYAATRYRLVIRALFIACALVVTAPAGPAAEPAIWTGYGGPGGSRVYRDAKPPVKFGPADIAWKVEIPDQGWGHASPVVAGDKVFLHVEFDEYTNRFPSLVCFSTKDGSVLWKQLLDHTPLLPNGAEVKAAWLKITDELVTRRRFMERIQKEGKTPEVEAALDAAGYINHKPGQIRRKTDGPYLQQERATAATGGLMLETWREARGTGGGTSSCVGHAYATPVTDGERVYVVTAFGGFFCFDLNGKLIWSAFSKGQMGEYCRNGRSPLLWKHPATGKKLLLSDITNKVRAFDAATGKLLWEDDAPGDTKKYGSDQGGGVHTIVSPAVMTVKGVDFLFAAGNNVYRLPDGKRFPVEGWTIYGVQTLVKHDERDVVFFTGADEHSGWPNRGAGVEGGPSSPAAVRFALAGETLKATVLWHGGQLTPKWNFRVGGGNAPYLVYQEGKLYHLSGPILDALTGQIVAGTFADQAQGGSRAVPETGHLLLIAGGHIYGLRAAPGRDNKGAAMMSVYTLDGKPVADNIIPDFASYGWTFAFDKNSIYARGIHHLIKIGK